jgi:hypothetical protein
MSMIYINARTAERYLPADLRPRVKTTVSGEGKVVFHDETRRGLRRMCVASYGKYPDLETWLGMLEPTAYVCAYRYIEKLEAGILFVGYLWIYYKMEGK